MAHDGGGWPGGSRRDVLAGDNDRERTVGTLNAAFTEGRLTPAEHDDRVGRAYAARTYGELAALVSDLPAGPSLPQPSTTYQPYPAYPIPGALPAQYAPPPRRNGMAVASLLTGLLGLLPLIVPSVAAVVLGHSARSQARQQGTPADGTATAGLVLGYASLSFWMMLFLAGIV